MPSEQHIKLLIQAGAFSGTIHAKGEQPHVVDCLPRKVKKTTIRKDGNRTITTEREESSIIIRVARLDGTIELLR